MNISVSKDAFRYFFPAAWVSFRLISKKNPSVIIKKGK